MGFFTWTLANKKPTYLKNGDYASSCKLGYYSYGAIITPDNEIIKEPCYEGYGIFNGHDAYDLVADWNRTHLIDIIQHPNFVPCPLFPVDNPDYMQIIQAFVDNDETKLQQALSKTAIHDPLIKDEWKRTIGILISCEDTNVKLLPYPLKIVNCVRPKPYAALTR